MQLSVYAFVYFTTGIITLLLAIYSWKRRAVPGTFWFSLLMLAAAEWCLTFSLELLVADPSLKVLIGKFQYLGIVCIAPLMLLFVAGYTRNDSWTRDKKALLLWVVPALTVILVFTNEMHGLVWPEIVPAVTRGTFVMVYANGPAALASTGYSYILAVASVSMLIFTLVQCSEIYRRQIWLLILCTGIFLISDLIDIFSLSPVPGLDLDPLALGICGIIVFEGAIRYRLLDIAPIVYHEMYSAMQTGVIAVDNQGSIIECNPAARQYLSLAGTAGDSPLETSAPALAELIRTAETDTGRQYEFSVGEQPDRKWFGARISLLKDYSSRPYGKLVIFHDITTCRKAQEDLQEAHSKLTILSSVTRHDILNNLTALDMYLDLCRQRVPDPSALGYFQHLQETSQTIRTHIEFMQYYEETGGKEPAWFDLRTVVLEAAAAHSFREVKVRLDSGETEIYADPLIAKVFYNLIDNAFTHGDHVTRCMVTAEETDDGLIIVFADDGCGIPAADKERIFTRGFGSQTGLGLFLIRRILSITGITIRETGEEGKGARFEIIVPAGKYRMRQTGTYPPGTGTR
ncbi:MULTISPECIES: histidine kinase N-terminal 7TM domain-containing protein [unclassified Methanoregula]|uniref:sensor histidine kinase n=1 Tax=unclassified Methanoregula TaxID=2649730 RepID=UPI0025F4CD7A|nr:MULTISPECIES: histidine kinase N-terminal 7TM domain-containing protein [unclassified Methanoregula]